eukprot:6066241-Ditylum_brightwellii.AAC.1
MLDIAPSALLVQDHSGKTPMHYACEDCHLDGALPLLMNAWPLGANIPDNKGRTLLHLAVGFCPSKRRATSVVPLLLSKIPAATRSQDWDGQTPLHYACMRGMTLTVRYLLEADPCAVLDKDKAGNSPLSFCWSNTEEEM